MRQGVSGHMGISQQPVQTW